MEIEEILNSDQQLIVAVARNNPKAVKRNLEPHNLYASQLTQKGIVESLFFLHKNQDTREKAWTAIDVPWLPGANTAVDQFVLEYAGQGSTLVRAVNNFKLNPHVITRVEKPKTKLQDPDMDWAVIFAFVMALIVIYVWTKTDTK